MVFPSNPTTTTLGSGFRFPGGVAVDGAGNVYVADVKNNAVKEVVAVGGSIPASNPTILTLGSGFSEPFGVAVDGAGNVYVADFGNNAAKEIVAVGGSIPASSPTILTLGSGFSFPFGVAVDGVGNVYVADFGNSAVKEIPLATPPSLSFASANVGSTSSDSPQTLLVQNIGNAALSFPTPSMGNNPSISTNFVLGGSSSCPLGTTGSPGSLAAGTCTYLISFTPTTTGSTSGALVFTDNSLTAGNNGMQSVPLSGTATAPVAATQAIASTTLTQNHAATSFTPVTGANGTGTLSYSVSPTLPAGLSYSTSTGAITGTASVTCAAIAYTVTVTDANGATATATFSLTVTGLAATQSIAALTQNHAATSFALPTGLTISSTTGSISGTPTMTSSVTTYTVTVTDANSATATATFSLTVNTAVTAAQAVAATTLVDNLPATAFTPVTGSGGTGTLSYGVSPALPTGLSFSTSTGTITGTATAASTATTYTVTVTDANSATATASFSLTAILSVAPTVSVKAIATPYGSTAGIVVTATESGTAGVATGGVVTFSIASPATGSFSPAICTLSAEGTCTTTYTPNGTLAAGTYANDIGASFAAVGSYAAASGTTTLTVTQVTPSVSLVSSANPVVMQNAVTFTATVSSSASVPTGTVSFIDGTVPLGSATLSNGTATFTTSALTVGTHSITAIYSGDTNFITVTSARGERAG